MRQIALWVQVIVVAAGYAAVLLPWTGHGR